MRKLKENRKKGFTLVELIVVLVILAILAALLVPALTGYIDKAKEKQVVAETRQCVMAAQTLIDEEFAKASPAYSTNVTVAAIKKLAEVPGTVTLDTSTDIDTDGHLKQLTYTNGISYKYEYNSSTQKSTYTKQP